MHHHLYPIVATSRHGDTVLLYDAEAVRAFVRGRQIGDHLAWWGSDYDPVTRHYAMVRRTSDWILRDDRGRRVDPGAFEAAICRDWRKLRARRLGDFEHRNGPVPGIRHHWRRNSMAARKRHGGRGVAARNALLHSGDPWNEVD